MLVRLARYVPRQLPQRHLAAHLLADKVREVLPSEVGQGAALHLVQEKAPVLADRQLAPVRAEGHAVDWPLGGLPGVAVRLVSPQDDIAVNAASLLPSLSFSATLYSGPPAGSVAGAPVAEAASHKTTSPARSPAASLLPSAFTATLLTGWPSTRLAPGAAVASQRPTPLVIRLTSDLPDRQVADLAGRFQAEGDLHFDGRVLQCLGSRQKSPDVHAHRLPHGLLESASG